MRAVQPLPVVGGDARESRGEAEGQSRGEGRRDVTLSRVDGREQTLVNWLSNQLRLAH
jgi:hypothetical protein